MSSTEEETDISFYEFINGGHSPDVRLLAELRFALKTMKMGVGVKNPMMLVYMASCRITRMEQHKNKAQE